MEASADIKKLLNSAKGVADKHKKILDEQMYNFLGDKFASEKDKEFILLMNSKIEEGFKSGNPDAIYSIITELTNKINK